MYSSSPVEPLICYCAEYYLAEVPIAPTYCNSDKSCDTTGKCLVYLVLMEYSGSLVERYTYRCVSDDDAGDEISFVDTLCGLDAPSPTQVVLCCNNTDFCNRHLNPRALLASLPAMTSTSTPSGGQGNTGTIRDYIVAMYVSCIRIGKSVKSFLK